MALITKSVKGTADILPKESFKLRFVEKILLDIAKQYGFNEIRTPVFEHTELFARGIGDDTDVVQKEMYTFNDKGGRSITLKPEGTAGTLRSVLEHGLHNDALPLKVSYITSCYRYEKPQAGRLREFHQFGVEMLGSDSPSADALVISLGFDILKAFKIKNISLEINNIGCHDCRKNYFDALKKFFNDNTNDLCSTCKARMNRNPMRILDCKNNSCSEIAKSAPIVLDYICDSCNEHFESVKTYLNHATIKYSVNPAIVRGLDYYTKTVFEFVSGDIGAKATVCGGGRYDGLIKELGGPALSALGFGLGIERLMLVLEHNNFDFDSIKPPPVDIYIASLGEKASLKAFELLNLYKNHGLNIEIDLMNRSLKSGMKYADKINANFTLILGDNELEKGTAVLKNMKNSKNTEIDLNDEKTVLKLIDRAFLDNLDFEALESNSGSEN